MILLAYIIMGHKDWKEAEIKIFAIYPEDNIETERQRLFELIKMGQLPISPKNVEFIARLEFSEMKALYQQSKVFLRLTKHDGLSLSVLEAMANEMHVVWTYKFPHTSFLEQLSKEALLNTINRNQDVWISRNKDGKSYVLDKFSKEAIHDNLKLLFEKIKK